jgi:hypothetical protein
MFRLSAGAINLAILLIGCASDSGPTVEPDFASFSGEPLSAYRQYAWTEALEIPDGDRRGILVGPVLAGDDGAGLGSVVLRVDVRHPDTEDLDIWLAYDADGDGNPEIRAPVEFFRSRGEVRASELHACPRSLDGTYLFRDGRGGEESVFAAFNALRRGHAFYLAVADTLPGEKGTLLGWAVYLEPDAAVPR